jgi:phosphoribosylanthranilate isomerase
MAFCPLPWAFCPRVKICCIASPEEARLAIEHGASAIGLVSSMPSGPGVIDEALIREIATHTPPPIATFLLTCLQDADQIIAQQRRCRTNTIQLCDSLENEAYAKLRDALPGISIVQVIHVLSETSIREAIDVAPHVDAILLDSGNPNLQIKELGGTGRRHDWTISRRIVESVNMPVFLAGGLRPDNIADAIAQVLPFGVDVCSGVRSGGALDRRKLDAFFSAAKV